MRRITILLAALTALMLVPAAAQAAEAHPYLPGRSLDGSNTPAGTFVEASGVAVDSQGDIYVSDVGHEYIDVFKPDGQYLTQIESPFWGDYRLAVDSEGVVYADGFEGELFRYEPSEYPFAGVPTYNEEMVAEEAYGIAVDPSNDQLYVAHLEGIVHYKSAAEGSGEIGPMPGEAATAQICFGLDVYGANHDVYCGQYLSGNVKIFDGTSGNAVTTIEGPNPPGEVFEGNGSASVAVDQTSGDVYYYYKPSKTVYQFTASGGLVSQIGPKFGVEELEFQTGEPSEPAVDPTTGDIFVNTYGDVYAFEGGEGGGGIEGPPLTTVIEEGTGTVVSNPAGIECTGGATHECTTEEIEAGSVTLTASPAPGYRFKSWKGCDKKSGEFGVNGRQCTISLTEARSVSAKFVKTYDVTLENGGNGKVSTKPGGALCLPNCSETSAQFDEGKTVEVLAKANKHFHLASWGGDCSGSGACSISSIAADHTVSASFAEDPKFDLAISKEGGGQALIKTKGPGTVCSYTCGSSTASFYEGEEVLVSWKLGKGTSSLTWTSGAGSCTGTHEGAEGSCTVTMSAANELVAELG